MMNKTESGNVAKYYDNLWNFKPDIPDNIIEIVEKKVNKNRSFFFDKLVLDAGCGQGRFSYALAGISKKLISIDRGSENIRYAKKILGNFNNVIFIQCDILKLPFKYNSFDFVFSNGVIHHINDPHKSFNNLTKIVCSKGYLYVGVYGKGLNQGLIDKCLRFTFSRIPIKWAIIFYSLFYTKETMLWSEKINMATVPSIQYRFSLEEISGMFQNAGFINVHKNNLAKTKNQELIEKYISNFGYKILKFIYGTVKGGRDSVWHEIIGEKK